MFIYQIAPIDLWWGVHTLKSLKKQLKKLHGPKDITRHIIMNDLEVFMENCKEEVKKAVGSYWDGDVREGPFVFSIPYDVEMKLGFAWKQDNNGTTYVCSPVELTHLPLEDRLYPPVVRS